MTPKEQFLKSSHAKAFAEICGTDTFYEAMHYAMLEIIDRPAKMDIDHRSFFEGVKALNKALFSIAIPEEPDKPTAKQSLNHDAYNSPARRALPRDFDKPKSTA